MKGAEKCANWGGWEWLGVIQGHLQCHHSIERIRLFVFNRNNASILYRSRDTASYLSKFTDFTLSHLYLAPPLSVTPFEFRKDFWLQKTRVPGLSCEVVCMILSVAILTQYRLVTDGRTDRHTTTANTARA